MSDPMGTINGEFVRLRAEIAALRRDMETCRIALRASLALGRKVYHNANVHEAPTDWARVQHLIVAALGDGRAGQEGGAEAE